LIAYWPNDLSNRFRAKRFRLFQEMLSQELEHKQRCKVLDVGGTPHYWRAFGNALDFSRVEITVVNVSSAKSDHDSIKVMLGDARNMCEFEDLSFDIVHSNSVIEHVGRWQDMADMAKEVRRLAPRYFVQTPYFWFPMEPHARVLALHWMPEVWRFRILMKRDCGFWQRRTDLGEAVKAIQSAVLLDNRQMQYLFPDAKIIHERVLGLTKSLIAVR
jgi:hypothetical protein